MHYYPGVGITGATCHTPCAIILVQGLQVHPAISHAPSFYVGSDKLSSGSTLAKQYFSN